MDQNQIEKAIKRERVQLSIMETIEHYFFLLPIFIMPIVVLIVEISLNNNIKRLIIFEIIMLLVSGYFIYHKYKSLEFKKHQIKHTIIDFQSAAIATSGELNWNIEELTNDFLIARKRGLDWQMGGLRITLIRKGNTIYSNSIINPYIGSNPFDFGWNKKNIETFNKNLTDASKGENVIKRVDKEFKQKHPLL